jgi:hypothetical protein
MSSLNLFDGHTIKDADVLLNRKRTAWPWKYYDTVKDNDPSNLTIFDYTITVAMNNCIKADRYTE